jgi:LPXTG-motif cell wall-anchored protein
MTSRDLTSFRGSRLRLAGKLAIPVLIAGAAVLVTGPSASASIVPTVNLLTAANYSVIGGQTVTNTGPSVLGLGLALSPGTDTPGFPPGLVLGATDVNSAVSLQAQSDSTAAYLDAAARSTEFTQANPDLVGVTLVPGVYSGTSRAPLSLSGQLVLDGQGNPNAVFIFQTDSTLTINSGSSVVLLNGASECNVFWQVGSSATLFPGSVFAGNILALTSISVQTGVIVHGRALAQTGSVTLDTDSFTVPDCTPSPLLVAPATTVAAPVATVPPAVVDTVATVPTFVDTDITLPSTGDNNVAPTSAVGAIALVLGATAILLARRRSSAA